MNNKQGIVNAAIEIVISCTAYEKPNGELSICREDILSTKRNGDNVGMVRCILCRVMLLLGFTKESIADLLNRTVETINDMLQRGNIYEETSYVYRVAQEEAEGKIKEFMANN